MPGNATSRSMMSSLLTGYCRSSPMSRQSIVGWLAEADVNPPNVRARIPSTITALRITQHNVSREPRFRLGKRGPRLKGFKALSPEQGLAA